MTELKTQRTEASVAAYVSGIADESRRRDCLTLLDMMRRATGEEPAMWGSSIVGFGSYHYTYASGRQGDWFPVGFASRKRALTVYVTPDLDPFDDLLAKLGKHRTGKGCIYIDRLADVDVEVLEELFAAAVARAGRAAGL